MPVLPGGQVVNRAGQRSGGPYAASQSTGSLGCWPWLVALLILMTLAINGSDIVKNWEAQHGNAPPIVAVPLPPPVAGVYMGEGGGKGKGSEIIGVSPLSLINGEKGLTETVCHELIHVEQQRRGYTMTREQREQEAYANMDKCGDKLYDR